AFAKWNQILPRAHAHGVGSDSSRYFGVTRNSPPVAESSISHSAPSGATAMSRTLRLMSQRSAALAPPFLSNVIRVSDLLPSPAANADPSHCGNILPS